jgi:hypothetical protein
MNAIEIADWISEYLEDIAHEPWGNNQIMMDEAQTMLRQLQAERDKLFLAHSHEMARADIAQMQIDKYKQVLESIANERIELSHDKIKWQCQDHIRWAKDVLKQSEFTDNNIVNSEHEELKAAVRSFFEDFLNVREESDSGRVFAPITISSSRCMMTDPLCDILQKMRKLSEAADAPKRESWDD